MSRTGITKQEVFAAIEEMCFLHKKVTALNIRARLGCGSVNTIHKHIVAWKQNRLWNTEDKSSNKVEQGDPELETHL